MFSETLKSFLNSAISKKAKKKKTGCNAFALIEHEHHIYLQPTAGGQGGHCPFFSQYSLIFTAGANVKNVE